MSLESQSRKSAHIFANPITRRRMMSVTASGIAGASIVTRGHALESGPAASPAGSNGEWTFTNDKGVTFTLLSTPKVIVTGLGAATPLWDFGVWPVAVSGWNASGAGTNDAAWGNIDRNEVHGENGAPDLETLIVLGAELFASR